MKNLKFIDKVERSVYIGVLQGTKFKNLFRAQITPSLCFGLICVRGKLNPANSGRLNFRKYTPLATTPLCDILKP